MGLSVKLHCHLDGSRIGGPASAQLQLNCFAMSGWASGKGPPHPSTSVACG